MQPPDDVGPKPRKTEQLAFELGHAPSLVEEDFIISDGNRLALEHICAYPRWSAPLSLISGPAQAGKSHLGRIWIARSSATMVGLHDLEAIASAGGRTPLLLEDVDRINYDEQAFFHLLNQCMRDNRPLLMTARQPIADWGYKTDDVRSRARLAAHFIVATPGDTQLSQMFAKLFADRQIEVDAKVVTYLVARMERSAAEVVALVTLMDAMAMARNGPISRSLAAEALDLRTGGSQLPDGDASDERNE